MIYNFIALGVIMVFLIGIGIVVARRYHQIKTIDVETISEEKEAQVRERILIERMRRRAESGKKIIKQLVKPAGGRINNFGRKMFKRISDLEKKYQKESVQKSKTDDKVDEQKINSFLQKAEEFFDKADYQEAEKSFIEVIGYDAQNIRAYKGLVNLYLEQKDYDQALQTAMFVLKLSKKKANVITKDDGYGGKIKTVDNAEEQKENYIKVGEILEEKGDERRAFEFFQKAFILNNNDPRILDLLIESAIIMRSKLAALDYLQKLEKVNPENQKLKDFKLKIAEL
ncbi:hypothetical protein A2300_03665 [Candidatus Falkowbacteria bacterium RIFOXYB2_FULL_35_7]|nr:MAG: hypothetical protein A2300_03665 [Candidatus Falkowbacteria bacterium RIFOXYB2_FULL_35_7]